MENLHTYRVAMVKAGQQRSADDVLVQARNEAEARRKAERMSPGFQATMAYKMG